MPNFLDDAATRWVIGTLVASLIAVLAVLVPYVQNRRRKHLWYTVEVFPVIQAGVDERIEVLFEGKPVPNVYTAWISLSYRGTAPILESDYRTPVTFDFRGANILTAEMVSTTPAGINASVKQTESSVLILEPIALNDGNELHATALLAENKYPKISGHIVDIREIRDEDSKRDLAVTIPFSAMGFLGLGVLTWAISTFVDDPIATPLVIIGTTLIAVGGILLAGYMFIEILRNSLFRRSTKDEDD